MTDFLVSLAGGMLFAAGVDALRGDWNLAAAFTLWACVVLIVALAVREGV